MQRPDETGKVLWPRHHQFQIYDSELIVACEYKFECGTTGAISIGRVPLGRGMQSKTNIGRALVAGRTIIQIRH
jgi:hypothetical protein